MMSNDYSNKLEKLLKQALPSIRISHQLEFKNCFGAVAAYVDGHIFISCGKFGVALKLPPETLAELFREKDVLHLQYFTNGHVKKEYAVIPQRIIDNQIRFKKLLSESIKHAVTTMNTPNPALKRDAAKARRPLA